MEPRKESLKQMPELSQEVSQSRFQIVKLEERIAPRIGHYPGWNKQGHYGPPGQTK